MTRLAEALPTRTSGYWGVDAGASETDARAIRNGDVGTSGDLRWDALPLRGYSSKEFAKAQVHAGDIVLTTSGNCGNVAYIGAEPAEPTVATNFVRILRTDRTKVDSRYAFHYLRSGSFTAGIAPFVRGATIKNLSVESAFDAITIPLPPLGEQRRLASVLDAADALRTRRRTILIHLGTLAQSVFHQMFGEVRASTTVADVAQAMRTGPFGSDLLHSEFVAEGVAVLGLDNVVGNHFRWAERRYITPEKYEKLKRYTVHPGDVLVSIMGTTGRCVVVPDDIPPAINTKHICATTVDQSKVLPHFLRASFLWHPDSRAHLRKQTKGSIMDGLNLGIIRTMPIPLPPLADQQAFEARIARVDGQRAAVQRALAADEELFASLQSRAFRGDL